LLKRILNISLQDNIRLLILLLRAITLKNNCSRTCGLNALLVKFRNVTNVSKPRLQITVRIKSDLLTREKISMVEQLLIFACSWMRIIETLSVAIMIH